MRVLQWIWPLLALAWTLVMARGAGPLPALGALLDFHSGVWNHHDFQWANHNISGLKKPVQVILDKAGVPHIFAQNEADLYRAQGYVMASQRLFQMDLSSRSTAGRLSQLVGPRALGMDRFFVRLGMRQLARKLLDDYLAEPHSKIMIENFVAGINSYIDGLTELPVEYKLIGKRPKEFDPQRVINMALALTFSLNGRNSGYVMSHLQQQIGTDKVLDLFPEFLPERYSDYVFPNSWGGKKRAPETSRLFDFATHIRDFPAIPQPARSNGSNNFAVGPRKSKTGHSILANDTHLGLSLPNIWFENQLSCPEFNVYGVSLVNVPGIINGFTARTAWGPTNGTTAALDFYEVHFKGKSSLDYDDQGKTETATTQIERIKIAGHRFQDLQVVWTKWGPVLDREGEYGLVASWTGFRAGNDLKALRELYETRDLKSCMQAFRDWTVPIQNWLCADPNHIGLVHGGFIPQRAVGEGRFIDPAGRSQTALNEPIGEKFRPLSVDPKEGFLRSANERVVRPDYPFYLGWDYEEPFRGYRIRELLRAQDKFSGEDLIRLQNDDYDSQAAFVLPTLLKTVNRKALTSEQIQLLSRLDSWDLRDVAGRPEGAVYKQWYDDLKTEIFSDEYELPERPGYYPHDMRIAWMLDRVFKDPKDSDAQWIDDKRTPQVETLADIVTRAFQKAWAHLVHDQGKDPARWTWKEFIQTRISHVAKIPGFGSDLLEMNGSGESVRGNKGWHGPVYKLVVELGEWPKAWVQVPGGNNGDPFSPQFERNVREWSQGEMRRAEFYRDLAEARRHAVQAVELTPGGP